MAEGEGLFLLSFSCSFFPFNSINEPAAVDPPESLYLVYYEVCFAIDPVSFRDRAFNRACIFEAPIGT